MGFVDAIKTGFAKYADFQGRASRSEYWWWTLFVGLVGVFLGILAGPEKDPNLLFLALQAVFSLGTLVPGLAVSVRRLHDLNRGGWWLLIVFTIIGIFVLLYWYVKKGTDGPNRFGADPLPPTVEAPLAAA